ncbi:hypothetical protein [Sphingomonas sp. Leaf343]|uniref:hypothetical protein n=1 Tax=Sphingomonas sp. Leaf343 TaxID=1736345 RepID=UPI000A63E80C|nr:hypothetical protein [Sphingomonas sp. Leaf343]
MFDIVHAVLPGPAAREGYHHESLANSVVVRIIRGAVHSWSRSSAYSPTSAGLMP